MGENEATGRDRGGSRGQLREKLAKKLGMPVIAVVAGWEGNSVVNLDQEAARAFLAVLDAELEARDRRPKKVGLFVVGRGGFAAFADGVWRALDGHKLDLHALVPYQCDGVFSLLGLAAERCVMHPYGALGAYDRRPLGRVVERINAELIDEVDVAPTDLDDGSSSLVAEIAAERRERRLCRRLMERLVGGADSKLASRVAARMSAEVLGSSLALSYAELERLGLSCERAKGKVADVMWSLYRAYETELGVLEPTIPRFVESDVADEVEFNPAAGLSGAFIEGSARQMRFELDTGSPDPDTNMLTGEWLWEHGDLEQPEPVNAVE